MKHADVPNSVFLSLDHKIADIKVIFGYYKQEIESTDYLTYQSKNIGSAPTQTFFREECMASIMLIYLEINACFAWLLHFKTFK